VVDLAALGLRLDLMILEVFPSLMIPWFYDITDQRSDYRLARGANYSGCSPAEPKVNARLCYCSPSATLWASTSPTRRQFNNQNTV